jgi:hypothetical protein
MFVFIFCNMFCKFAQLFALLQTLGVCFVGLDSCVCCRQLNFESNMYFMLCMKVVIIWLVVVITNVIVHNNLIPQGL